MLWLLVIIKFYNYREEIFVLEKFNLIQPKEISLKDHPELNEAWLQEVIANKPEILGLGDLIVKDKERIQPSGGRLDLLLQDVESLKRYEMEIQLGKTDESHIIRTIEYWDIDKSVIGNQKVVWNL